MTKKLLITKKDLKRLEHLAALEKQLALWVAGEAVHVNGKYGGVCCPDFSCCKPAMFTEKAEREAFRDSDGSARHLMLVTFLGRAFGPKVYIAGDPANYQEPS
jgi:hypothetical protein